MKTRKESVEGRNPKHLSIYNTMGSNGQPWLCSGFNPETEIEKKLYELVQNGKRKPKCTFENPQSVFLGTAETLLKEHWGGVLTKQ
jgi:hypothetical protein